MSLEAVYASQQRYEEAEQLYQSCLEARVAVLGESHQETLRMINSLAKLNINQKKYEEAEALLVKCLEVGI
jgi:tetratricopeptide (TPR) repeat protein